MYTYTLSEPFELTTQGQDHIIESITMKAPTAKVCAFTGGIEVEINRAAMALAEKFADDTSVEAPTKKEESEEDKIDGMVTMLQASGVDVVRCYGHLKQCITSTKAKFNENIVCNNVSYDEIPSKELTRLLAWYVVNFINTSF